MQCRFAFRRMETSSALIEYAEPKILDKVRKYSTKPIDVHLTFSLEGHDHRAHCSVRGGDGFNFEVEATCNDMYGSLDLLVDKLDSQMRKQKERLKEHKNHTKLGDLGVSDPYDREDSTQVPADADDIITLEKKTKQTARR